MKDLILYKEIDKNKNYILIKEIKQYEQFKSVIKVFSNPPYNEILSDKDCEAEFNSYIDNGLIIGCFINNNLAGINCILNDVPSEYSITFNDTKKVAYYSGLAVKENYRKLGLGKLLVAKTQTYLDNQNKYDYSFARILCNGSMSEGIFKQNNFEDAYYNNELIIDEVEYSRNTGNIEKDKRKYMVRTMRNSNNYYYKR